MGTFLMVSERRVISTYLEPRVNLSLYFVCCSVLRVQLWVRGICMHVMHGRNKS